MADNRRDRGAGLPFNADASTVAPYLPRLVIEWLAEHPSESHTELAGSLVFVDISGFTQLSERLARLGKVGAEELTDIIASCFERLLAIAYADGASLLKFGGDALLLFFTGVDHELRACRASVGMRRTLREVGRIRAAGVAVSLRMSVGIHSGLFHLFLVGDSHRELLVVGPGASATVRMEATAQGGEILVSGPTAAALAPSWLGDSKGDGRLLRRSPPGSSAGEWERFEVDAGVDLTIGVPAALRDTIGTLEAEHRRVTVGFIHFDGTDEVIRSLGPEEAGARLDHLVSTVQRAADRWQIAFLASDVDYDGGKLIVVGGAPVSSGDDERRVLLMLREVIETDLALTVRVGVNQGYVFAGTIGPHYRHTFTVMGDAVNLAARLMTKAAPGQVVAGHGVVAQSKTEFETTPLEPFFVKGKSKPVHALLVGPAIGAATAGPPTLPLVGRDRELELLVAWAGRAAHGEGTVVEVVGEPGLGKSRLLEELQQRTASMRQLSISCGPYDSFTPYFAVRSLMSGLLGLAEGMTDEEGKQRIEHVIRDKSEALLPWTPLLSAVVDVPMDDTRETEELEEKFRRTRLAEVVTDLLTLLLPEPTLLSIEDSHWMDEPSAALLHHLAPELQSRPWLICTTRRDQETGFVAPADRSEMLRLNPLETREAAELLRLATETSPMLGHELADLIERSGGNPLFIRELIATAFSAGNAESLPDSIEGLVTARLDRLPREERNLIRRAAVLGRAFSFDLLAYVLDAVPAREDDVWRRLADMLVIDGDQVRFEHALIRDAAYQCLPYRARRDLHARVGDAIRAAAAHDGDDQAEQLSLHYLHAQRSREAWVFSRVAAQRARSVYANLEAAQFCERALEAARHLSDLDPNELAEVHEELGDARTRVGAFVRAEAAYRSVRRYTKADPVADARLLLKLSWLQGWMDNYARGLRLMSIGLRKLEGFETPAAARQRSQLLAWYGHFCQDEGRHARAIKWCRRAIDEARAADDKDALAHALRVLGWADQDLGRLDQTAHLDQALVLYEELGDLPGQAAALNLLGMFAYFVGDWPTALERYERARATLERAGDVATQAFEITNIGEILSDQGHLNEAAARFADALRIWQAAGNRSGIAYAKCNLGRLAARRGRYDEAFRLYEESRAEAEAIGAHAEALETTARVAECLIASGDASRALAAADRALERARALGGVAAQAPLLHRVRGAAFLRVGEFARAQEALEESLAVARARTSDFDVALTLRAQFEAAVHAGLQPDKELWNESQSIFDRLGVVSVPDPLWSGTETKAVSPSARQ